jgi:hypothetical protein
LPVCPRPAQRTPAPPGPRSFPLPRARRRRGGGALWRRCDDGRGGAERGHARGFAPGDKARRPRRAHAARRCGAGSRGAAAQVFGTVSLGRGSCRMRCIEMVVRVYMGGLAIRDELMHTLCMSPSTCIFAVRLAPLPRCPALRPGSILGLRCRIQTLGSYVPFFHRRRCGCLAAYGACGDGDGERVTLLEKTIQTRSWWV